MRITGGSARGRQLVTPKSGSRVIRPTGDRVREALFNILAQDIPGSTVLDLYAGTGSFGLEALSRGAGAVFFIDQSKQALELIHTNVKNCFPTNEAVLLRADLSRGDSIGRLQKKFGPDLLFDLIFLDPPYEKKLAETTLEMVEQSGILQRGGVTLVEERKTEQLPQQCGAFQLVDQRVYGETGIWFYRHSS